MNLSKFDIRGRSDVGAGGVVGLGILYCLSFLVSPIKNELDNSSLQM